jgi:hypothetical protein
MQSLPCKRAFYKYASADTVLAILSSGTVRYSSPLLFNDPFDIQSGIHFDFDPATLHTKVIDRIHELAAASSEPTVDPTDPWGKLVLEARRHYRTHSFPRERWLELTRAPFAALVEEFRRTQQQYQAHWWNKLLPGVRVFCVSEDPDNLLMWAHYAREHTGAVLELWSLPEEDNPLSVASAVEYREVPPAFFSEAEWIDDLTGVRQLDFSAFYRRYAYIKSNHWSYEREWRVWYPLADETGRHDPVPVRGSEFTSIRFGCRADPAFVKEALALLRERFPTTRALRAKKRDGEYGLGYEEV